MKKRALILAGLLLAAAVVSCGKATGEEPSSTAGEEFPSSSEEADQGSGAESEPGTGAYDPDVNIVYTVYPEPEFPDLDLTGKTFRISTAGGTTFSSEGLNGEIINDTVFARNLKTEERFGIKIDMEYTSSEQGNLEKIVSSGMSEYDMVFGVGEWMTGLLSRGYALDLTDIPYIDFSQGYWFPNLLERFSCYDMIFLTPSDIDPTILGATHVTFFNKRILSEYDLENPYQMVYDNTWTLDNFLTMVRQVSRDVNGDGVMDEHDEYGLGEFWGDASGTFTLLAVGSGMRLTKRNDDGSLSFAVDGEWLQKMIDRTSEVLKDRSVSIDLRDYQRKIGENESILDITLFQDGHELFILSKIEQMQRGLRDMEDDFGVVPIPKYDESQKDYYHRAGLLTCYFCVPATSPDLEKTGAVFTYMTWLSNQTVLPAYYEVTLKQKRTRDEDSAYMLDLIHNTISFEFGDVWTELGDYIGKSFETGSYERTVGSMMKVLTKSLNKLQQKLLNLN